MIELTDIETAVAQALTENNYTVIANEVREGFTKPACFIDVLPVSVTLENQFSELVTVSVEISYFPAVETKEELITNSEKMKQIFLYAPLKVNDRFLSVNEISFDNDKSALITYFELEFLQETNIETDEHPLMENLKESVVTESHGTSADTD